MKVFPNNKNYMYNVGRAVLHAVKEYVKAIEENNMQDEQFFIDWEDSINAISVKDHNT